MVVTLRHSPGDNNAAEIDYAPNLFGLITAKDSVPDLAIRVLGHTVVLDNASLSTSLAQGNVVVRSAASPTTPAASARCLSNRCTRPPPGGDIRDQGIHLQPSSLQRYLRNRPTPRRLGSTVTVSYTPGAIRDLPAEPTHGMYVQVETRDTQPGSGGIPADTVAPFAPRTVFPRAQRRPRGACHRAMERFRKRPLLRRGGETGAVDDTTAFAGGGGHKKIRTNQPEVQVQGTETGGILSAARIVFR